MLESTINLVIEHGLEVAELDMRCTDWGFYDHRLLIIYLNRRLTRSQKVVTLLHELEHHKRGDEGPQSTEIEQAIDAKVACQLISDENYKRAEFLCDSMHSIALELDLPIHIVTAWQRAKALSGEFDLREPVSLDTLSP